MGKQVTWANTAHSRDSVLPRTRYLKRKLMNCHLHLRNLVLLTPAFELQRAKTIQRICHDQTVYTDTFYQLIKVSFKILHEMSP